MCSKKEKDIERTRENYKVLDTSAFVFKKNHEWISSSNIHFQHQEHSLILIRGMRVSVNNRSRWTTTPFSLPLFQQASRYEDTPLGLN